METDLVQANQRLTEANELITQLQLRIAEAEEAVDANIRLQQAVDRLTTEAATMIAQFQVRIVEGDKAIVRCIDLQIEVDRLRGELLAVKTPDVWDQLVEGWLVSDIGKRTLGLPEVDLTGFQLGVERQNFRLIQLSYANIVAALDRAGTPVTPAEQQQIQSLLTSLDFA